MEIVSQISQVLKQGYLRKKKSNPRVSVRWLAGQLSLSPAMTSMILNGKRLPSLQILGELCRHLDIDFEVEDRLRKNLLKNKNNSATISDLAFSRPEATEKENKARDWHRVDDDQLVALEDWHYFAIMQTMLLKAYDGGIDFIADFLGVSHKKVEKAVAKLLKAGLVEKDPDTGCFYKTHYQAEFTSRDRSRLTHHHIKNMEKVTDILQNRSSTYNRENRLVTSSCFTCRQEDIPVIKQKIADLLKEVASTDSSQGHEEVCFFLAQFVPLSNR